MSLGEGSYKVIKDGQVLEFTHWDQIPEAFDELIKFSPILPPPPHTDEQHEEIEKLSDKLKSYMKRIMSCACCN